MNEKQEHDLPVEITSGQDPKQVFSLRVGNVFFKRLDQHLFLLKRMLGEKTSRQRWIAEAIEEKLKREAELDPSQIEKEKRLGFKLDKGLSKLIDKQVEFHRRFRTTYSKKQWILEAVSEKLEREEPKVRTWLRDVNE